jgi:death-on-curing protein
MKIRQLTLDDAEFIAHSTAVELLHADNEPIPPFNTRHPGKLESCLAQPFQSFNGRNLYRTLAERAAVLFYLISKNHCFVNGNKRMAVTLTLVLLFTNKRWVNVGPVDLYNLACTVAESGPSQRDAMHVMLTEFFRSHMKHLHLRP